MTSILQLGIFLAKQHDLSLKWVDHVCFKVLSGAKALIIGPYATGCQLVPDDAVGEL
jgi:hypothetical protein